MAVSLRLMMVTACVAGLAVTCIVACGDGTSGDGSAVGCGAPSACQFPNEPAQHFDAVRGCVEPSAVVNGLCVGTKTGPNCRSASIRLACVLGPDGSAYVAALTGYEYFSGFGSEDTESATCLAARCAPPCPGASPLPLRGIGCAADAGPSSADASDADAARDAGEAG